MKGLFTKIMKSLKEIVYLVYMEIKTWFKMIKVKR